MVALSQLDVGGYRVNTFDYGGGLAKDGLPSYRDWVEVFRKSIPAFRAHALTDPTIADAQQRAEAAERFAASFNAALDRLLTDSAAAPLHCLELCALREDCLHAAGFTDIFAGVKAEENQRALALLPGVLAELDALASAAQQLELAVRGVLAGNIFDLGAEASAALHAAGGGAGAFGATRERLLPRPWAVDTLDALLADVEAGRRWRQAALFVDNAGPDIVLGMLPLARVLLGLGTKVLLLANRGPTINDVTAAELQPLLLQAAQVDARLAGAVEAGAIRVVCSGSDMPVIDLTQLSQEAVDACSACDLIVLEGMGRAIETNLNAVFTCDSLKLGMIKHPEVAASLGGRMYDGVVKYDKGHSTGMQQA
ncbi:hypothetical protein HYH03_001367 [Edaphochlamys debaryana]|uniref:Damage-control phosphatase ARMT1-like metal-binding domain-containing protein n=1 Tax=Edaphochlamys debaryana TaxID=47281 RepID=A0A835YMV7_9CHLO|nr:hypothetical protein HYH03_001367 [Edaphochlamys debaryana]|eukprot:KAG2500599.1 hypothetical protein HYH03_001367 [Edaphochlamys debaryana]